MKNYVESAIAREKEIGSAFAQKRKENKSAKSCKAGNF